MLAPDAVAAGAVCKEGHLSMQQARHGALSVSQCDNLPDGRSAGAEWAAITASFKGARTGNGLGSKVRICISAKFIVTAERSDDLASLHLAAG